ncbi:magnesium transporter [Natronospirillum operosum]|uniref:Magnesium transporter n=1 Tax=Natronospirillum operosum TaxID=2759953 RepID=A0A4Z0WE97_9GAMM|nr:magnesium transporter [Natronospirillum operosum]TGG92471.1 magnesium transporter [Natronospirillum operosum]
MNTITANTVSTASNAQSNPVLRHHPVSEVMRKTFLNVDATMTAEQALELVRKSDLNHDATSVLFVSSERSNNYRGFVRLSALLRATADTAIGALVEAESPQVKQDVHYEVAARELHRTDIPMLPVTDDENRLVGVLTFDDAMDVLEQEASEDMYWKAGVGDLTHQKDAVRSEKLTSGSIGYPVKVRLMFLMVTLAGGMMVGGVIDHFEGVLEALVALAIFIPLVMDMGGNVGTQSTTIFARGLALGHIDLNRFFRVHVWRELKVGLTMGVLLAVLGGTIAYFWQGAPNGIPMLGVVVGLSLMFSVTTASLLGFLIPWILLKLGVDHAPGADPFITTIKDFSGLAVYFLTAAWLLGISG